MSFVVPQQEQKGIYIYFFFFPKMPCKPGRDIDLLSMQVKTLIHCTAPLILLLQPRASLTDAFLLFRGSCTTQGHLFRQLDVFLLPVIG